MLASVAVVLIGVAWRMQHQQSSWLTKEKELLEDSARWQYLAGIHDKRADAALGRADDAQKVADAAIAELEAGREKWKKRPRPVTIEECDKELDEYDARLAIAEHALAYTRIANTSLREAIEEKDGQLESLANALTAERKRGDGWKRQTRKSRVKTAFFGIGMAGAGALLGYGGAQAAK